MDAFKRKPCPRQLCSTPKTKVASPPL